MVTSGVVAFFRKATISLRSPRSAATVFLALAGLALAAPAPAWAWASVRPSRPTLSKAGDTQAQGDESQSVAVRRVADWIAASGDNGSLPYLIVDKKAASALLFGAKGKLISQAPVLDGIAPGDDATPGFGSKKLAEIGPAEKTTPAGRFLARYGLAAGRQKVLWVDYAASVALHPIPKDASPKERRRQRMLSPTADDHRITFGCINVPTAFYQKNVRPLFLRKGGYVYVLPDTKPLDVVFPSLRAQASSIASAP